MTLIKYIRRALGFPTEPIEEEEFDSVNSSFGADFRDLEEERHFDQSPSDTVPTIGLAAVNAPLNDDERRHMMEELVRLREDNKLVAKLKDSMEKQRLSAERQKRALSDRVIDLQNRVIELEAENEKIRKTPLLRASVDDEALQKANNDIAALRAEIESLNAVISEQDGELQLLSAENERLSARDKASADNDKLIENLRNKIERLRSERDSQRKTIETQLYNQANSEARLRKEIKALKKLLTKAGIEVPDAPDAPEPKPRAQKPRPETDIQPTLW